MKTYILTNDNAILEINVSDDNAKMTAVFKKDNPNIYDEAAFNVTRNPDEPMELLKDILDQKGFFDNPEFDGAGWEVQSSTDNSRVGMVIRAKRLIDDAIELLAQAGLTMVYDDANSEGVVGIMPMATNFDEDDGDTTSETDDRFIGNCPSLFEMAHTYTDGIRVAKDIPGWWDALRKELANIEK